MPRSPNIECAGACGRLLWGGRGSLPAGQRMCRECRRVILAPKTSSRDAEPKAIRPRRLCGVDGCARVLHSRGVCRKHWAAERRREGVSGWGVEKHVLSAMCNRWSSSAPKVKKIVCLLTVGIMPECPMCDALMSPLSGHHFLCRNCWTEALFNLEEVSWLATSGARSTRA